MHKRRPMIMKDIAMALGGGRSSSGTSIIRSHPGSRGPKERYHNITVNIPTKTDHISHHNFEITLPSKGSPREALDLNALKLSEVRAGKEKAPAVLPRLVADHVRELATREGHNIDSKLILEHNGSIWRFVEPKETNTSNSSKGR